MDQNYRWQANAFMGIYPVNFDANKIIPLYFWVKVARKVPSATGATAGTLRLWQPTIILSSLQIVVGYPIRHGMVGTNW